MSVCYSQRQCTVVIRRQLETTVSALKVGVLTTGPTAIKHVLAKTVCVWGEGAGQSFSVSELTDEERLRKFWNSYILV